MSTRFKVSTLEIAGFASVLAALRLPFGKEMRSKADWQVSTNNNILFQSSISIDPKDLTLMSTLVKRGDEHAKAIRGLQVYAAIEALVGCGKKLIRIGLGLNVYLLNRQCILMRKVFRMKS